MSPRVVIPEKSTVEGEQSDVRTKPIDFAPAFHLRETGVSTLGSSSNEEASNSHTQKGRPQGFSPCSPSFEGEGTAKQDFKQRMGPCAGRL